MALHVRAETEQASNRRRQRRVNWPTAACQRRWMCSAYFAIRAAHLAARIAQAGPFGRRLRILSSSARERHTSGTPSARESAMATLASMSSCSPAGRPLAMEERGAPIGRAGDFHASFGAARPTSHAHAPLLTGAVDAATGHCMARSRSDRLVGPIHVPPKSPSPRKRARIAPAWPRPNTLPS
ncbi:hypothetical protein GGP41_007934 [Bipolaris sorokiniana]|uniref:Uncharacterized protein n=1 Tax=Cochliobolus sativus TaxID=45130 RepID=A0A8H5ZQN5_COCSA|nr:hypothetical protein GGP41_007934 [Bipolaris sorokiniana]